MKHQALIYGTIAIDTLYTPHGSAQCELGGSGSFAALAARLVSPRIKLLGIVGSDFPHAFAERLKKCGVKLRHVHRAEGRTFAWTARYEDDMNVRETIETVEGVQQNWEIKLSPKLQKSSLVMLCNVTPRLQSQLLTQCSKEAFSMADFMKSWIERERDYVNPLLARVDLALMNDEEARCYAACEDLSEAAKAVLATGARFVIIKHGSEGSSLYFRNANGEINQHDCPAYPLKQAKDPTGAGDSYMGALGAFLMERIRHNQLIDGEVIAQGMRIASCIAARVCESFGTHAIAHTTRKQILSRLKKFKG